MGHLRARQACKEFLTVINILYLIGEPSHFITTLYMCVCVLGAKQWKPSWFHHTIVSGDVCHWVSYYSNMKLLGVHGIVQLSLIAESISQLQVWAASIAETHLHVSKWPVIALNAHGFGINAPCGLAFKLMLAQVFLAGKGNQSIVLGLPAWSLCHCCHMRCIFLVAVKHYLVTISTNFLGRINNRVAFV